LLVLLAQRSSIEGASAQREGNAQDDHHDGLSWSVARARSTAAEG
jgi:hypothetical protein